MKEYTITLTVKTTEETPLIYVEQLLGDCLQEDENIVDFDYTSSEKS